MRTLTLVLIVFLITFSCFPAERHAAAPADARYYRLICLVHLTGSGRPKDPVRPEYVPSAPDLSRAGILAWSMQPTDDRSMAILHVVAADRKAFDGLLNDRRAEIRVFEIGRDSRAAIETEMRRYSRQFSLDSLRVVAR